MIDIIGFANSQIELTLFPIPYYPFPIPYSLFPIPYSLFPIPYSKDQDQVTDLLPACRPWILTFDQ